MLVPPNPTSITKIIERLIRARKLPNLVARGVTNSRTIAFATSFRAEREREKKISTERKVLPVAFLFFLTAEGSKPYLKHGPSPPVAERQKKKEY